MAVPAVTLTREIMNQYGKAGIASKSKPTGIWIQPMVRDFIPIMSYLKTPLNDAIKVAGTTDQNVLRFGEGDILPQTTTLTAGINNAVTAIPVTELGIFQQWSVIRISTERMLVTAAPSGTGAGNLTVSRNFGGAGALSALNGDTVYNLGVAVPENALAPDSPLALGNSDENYCQIMEYTWSNSHRSRVTPDEESKGDRFRYEQTKKMKEAALHLDNLLLWGLKNEGDGSKTNPSTFGGLLQFTTAHANPQGSTALDLIDLMNGLQAVAIDVGPGEMGHTLMMSFRASRIFNSFFKGPRRYPGTGDIRLQEDGFDSDFGKITKMINHRMPDDTILLWNPQDCKRVWFEGGMWATGLYSTQGWFDRGFLRCDTGVMWTGDRRRAKWTGFLTDDNSYPNLDVV